MFTCVCMYVCIRECVWKGCLHNFRVCDNYDIFICYEGVTGQMLYWIMWEAVRRLEEINLKVRYQHVKQKYGHGFKSFPKRCVMMKYFTYFMQVIVFVCDGAKPNRKFFKLLGKESEMKHGVIYKTVNHFCQERNIYFMSDVPHLIKTTRNCWYSSKSGGARYMWVCTCSIVHSVLCR